MLKYTTAQVTFSEIPSEICLCINISNCPHRCPGCHSKYLQEDIGDELTEEIINTLIQANTGITCIVFLGGDSDKQRIKELGHYVLCKGLKSAWYSGDEDINFYDFGWFFDYIKIGPFIKSRGPLTNPNTNQKLYKIDRNYTLDTIYSEDITNKFWKNDSNS